MSLYLLALGIIFLINLLPAFAPPTWTILVYFSLRHSVHPAVLVLLGVIGATGGRAVLASSFRAARSWLPKGYVANMESVGRYLQAHARGAYGIVALFFISPISSAQLFEGAGIVKSIRLKPLLLAFACGRLISYSFYVSGAHVLKTSSLGELMTRTITSPEAITLQIIFILALVALGNVKWGRERKRPKPMEFP